MFRIYSGVSGQRRIQPPSNDGEESRAGTHVHRRRQRPAGKTSLFYTAVGVVC